MAVDGRESCVAEFSSFQLAIGALRFRLPCMIRTDAD